MTFPLLVEMKLNNINPAFVKKSQTLTLGYLANDHLIEFQLIEIVFYQLIEIVVIT